MGPDEIRQELAGWRRSTDRRDMLVKMAYQAAIQIKEISQITGLSRTTIYRILGLDSVAGTTDT
jgi:transcriptional regulator of acetoin/glycerol metabolism